MLVKTEFTLDGSICRCGGYPSKWGWDIIKDRIAIVFMCATCGTRLVTPVQTAYFNILNLTPPVDTQKPKVKSEGNVIEFPHDTP